MARPEKVAVVDEIAKKIEDTQSLFLTDFSGLDVESINELRCLLRKNAVEYRVVKNTLARLAADKAGRQDLKPYLVGPTAMAFGFEDPVLPAKLLSQFAKKTGKPSVKAILFENQILGQEAMDLLKALPSREQLLIKALSGLKAPITHVVLILGGLLRNLMGVFEALSQAKDVDVRKKEGKSPEAIVEGRTEKAQAEKEEKAGRGTEERVEERVEGRREVEEEPAEETKPKHTEEESSTVKPEGHEGGEADSQTQDEGPSEEVKLQNEKKADH